MAKKLNADTAGESQKNTMSPQERDDLIAKIIADCEALDNDRREFNAAASKRRKTISALIRGELGYTVKVFNDEFLNPHREKVAKDSDGGDEEMWEMRLSAKAEAARFLKIGEQIELFGHLAKKETRKQDAKPKNGKGGKDAPAEITDTLTVAKRKGTEAGEKGENFDSCPYPQGSKQRKYWEQNWHAAQQTALKKQFPDADTAAATTH